MEEGKLKGITTTNYDPVFEDALNSVTLRNEGGVRIDKRIAPAKIFEFMFSLNKGNMPKRILHLHGVYEKQANSNKDADKPTATNEKDHNLNQRLINLSRQR